MWGNGATVRQTDTASQTNKQSEPDLQTEQQVWLEYWTELHLVSVLCVCKCIVCAGRGVVVLKVGGRW